MNERQIWQVAIGLGKPDREGPGSVSSEEIHPVALLLEGSVRKVDPENRVPCVTGFGPVSDLAEAAVRLKGDDYDLAQVPFECTLTVYMTDEEVDALLEQVAADLAVDAADFSPVADRQVTVALRPIFDYAQKADSYRYLVDQWSMGGQS
ncbi:hypothetical protein NN3_46540 [Nocardia neocaledoniensis NBRC 108232]|uniref:Uncharacterized protein n=1 Tax=Nocardia neocaledoniensis TaxID=236511 RepID=A0A317NF76_9NOCA|nr:hypothetical protein [Nocardia neocaledoniensis]PWV72308.1 hypothetical protein DFR69_109225 [Nocardia neocaledoniensis]GEM33647.1 hypothetical protein NN3_46540 [Nocardia neocaledoniensis NBRC 108232]